jgi:AbrB family looped-hinge helix DNA binding protein
MAVVTTSSRGQIVIPKEIRERLEIVPGRKLLIKAEGDHVAVFLRVGHPSPRLY